MRRICQIGLLLSVMMLLQQTVWADNVVVFQETFAQTNGSGGCDGQFSGNIAQGNLNYDVEGWNASKCQGAKECLKFGTAGEDGAVTTPTVSFTGTQLAVLTFSAAGWGDANENKLTVSVSGGTISGDKDITLQNAEWNEYKCVISGASSFTITFTGKRGFLDDVVVTHITTVEAPTLTDECTFWPNTTETASKSITVTPSLGTTVRYTTDGSTPTTTNGTEATMTASFSVHATTTVKAIAYVGNVTSDVVSKTYTHGQTVNGVEAFSNDALADGTEVRLYLASTDNARVLHNQEGKVAYLRTNGGTLCLDFGTMATFNPAPAHNQHVAGWIIGRKQYDTDTGMLSLVATANTNTDYLVLAVPVTEPATQPTEVGNNGLSAHVGDWVLVKDVRQDLIVVENVFGCEQATQAYDHALMDVSAIALNGSKLAPVYYNDITPVVYVVDENQEYRYPASPFENVTVRLKRTLSKDYWNTFVVPFAITGWGGHAKIRSYGDYVDGKMHFVPQNNIEACVPYLIKPNETIENPVFTGVTLCNENAHSVGDNTPVSFVGIFSPIKLATDGSQLFLTTSGTLAVPVVGKETLKGMRAYFQLEDGFSLSSLLIDIDGETTDISSIDNGGFTMKNKAGACYDLSGRRVLHPQKGVYIMNGKKIIIH